MPKASTKTSTRNVKSISRGASTQSVASTQSIGETSQEYSGHESGGCLFPIGKTCVCRSDDSGDIDSLIDYQVQKALQKRPLHEIMAKFGSMDLHGQTTPTPPEFNKEEQEDAEYRAQMQLKLHKILDDGLLVVQKPVVLENEHKFYSPRNMSLESENTMCSFPCAFAGRGEASSSSSFCKETSVVNQSQFDAVSQSQSVFGEETFDEVNLWRGALPPEDVVEPANLGSYMASVHPWGELLPFPELGEHFVFVDPSEDWRSALHLLQARLVEEAATYEVEHHPKPQEGRRTVTTRGVVRGTEVTVIVQANEIDC